MKYVFSALLLWMSVTVTAQDSAKVAKWHYFGLHGAGLMVGGSQQSLSLLTTNGISRGNWYGGITTGIDWYGIRSVPVLASLYRSFGKGRNQPFVYGNAGLSCPWEKPYEGYRYSSAHYLNSFMGEVGVGYFISLKNKTALSLSAGYSYKTVRTRGIYYNDVYYITGWGSSYYTEGFDNLQHYRRVAIRLGIKI